MERTPKKPLETLRSADWYQALPPNTIVVEEEILKQQITEHPSSEGLSWNSYREKYPDMPEEELITLWSHDLNEYRLACREFIANSLKLGEQSEE